MKIEKSQSLYDINDGKVRIYFRYSKRHRGNRSFFGLRKVDMEALQGRNGVICFLWDGQREPLFVPFEDFEDVFASVKPADDGQYKPQIFEMSGGTELYIPHAGRFNVDGYFGLNQLEALKAREEIPIPDLSHSQVQTLLGSIGARKGFDIWIPPNDRPKLDWKLTNAFTFASELPPSLQDISDVVEEIDVLWLERGACQPAALYEVEHSTPIYSGLLRFNDVQLLLPGKSLRFGIVSNEERRGVFVRQLARPTFRASGLHENCTFLEYRGVYGWHLKVR